MNLNNYANQQGKKLKSIEKLSPLVYYYDFKDIDYSEFTVIHISN